MSMLRRSFATAFVFAVLILVGTSVGSALPLTGGAGRLLPEWQGWTISHDTCRNDDCVAPRVQEVKSKRRRGYSYNSRAYMQAWLCMLEGICPGRGGRYSRSNTRRPPPTDMCQTPGVACPDRLMR